MVEGTTAATKAASGEDEPADLIVRSAEHGLLCVGTDGINYLDEIEHVGDLAVISTYDPETGEIAAFE